jgi:hypothetical protein
MFVHGIAFLIYVLLHIGNTVATTHLKHTTVAEVGNAIAACNGQAHARDYDFQLNRCDGEGPLRRMHPS